MSSSLVWKPVVPQDSNYLDDQLKFILREVFSLPMNFSQSDTSYLRGLRDAGVKGAQELIEAIEAHNIVKVSEEY